MFIKLLKLNNPCVLRASQKSFLGSPIILSIERGFVKKKTSFVKKYPLTLPFHLAKKVNPVRISHGVLPPHAKKRKIFNFSLPGQAGLSNGVMLCRMV